MSGNKGKSLMYETIYSHHLPESSSRNSSAEEAYRKKELVHAELDKRLKILEDEATILKVAFLEGVDERRKLLNAIHNEFQAVNHLLHHGEHTFEYPKRQQHGLPQILGEEPNPTVVIRELRASEAVFQDATERVCELSYHNS